METDIYVLTNIFVS